MKKLFVLFALFAFNLSTAQYCVFFDVETDQPEMVVSTIDGMMKTEWGKNIQGTASLFALFFNGKNKATHSMQFCFPNEGAFAQFMTSWGQSKMAQLLGDKLGTYSTDISQTVNTPAWYKNDWANDNVFMIWQMDVTNPSAYVSAFADFSQKFSKKLGFKNSYGVGFPIVGQTDDYSHFVWVGAPDVETALSRTKGMYTDPLFGEYAKKVNGIRTVKNTYMMVRLMDFK